MRRPHDSYRVPCALPARSATPGAATSDRRDDPVVARPPPARESFAFTRVQAADDDAPASARRLRTAVYATILVATVLLFVLSGR